MSLAILFPVQNLMLFLYFLRYVDTLTYYIPYFPRYNFNDVLAKKYWNVATTIMQP